MFFYRLAAIRTVMLVPASTSWTDHPYSRSNRLTGVTVAKCCYPLRVLRSTVLAPLYIMYVVWVHSFRTTTTEVDTRLDQII